MRFDLEIEKARSIRLNTPDGAHAAHRASAEFNRILREYSAVMRLVSDYLLGGQTRKTCQENKKPGRVGQG